MIRRVVDFALNNRLLVLALALILFAGGIVSFKRLPIEAYPDVADNYVEVITQWPGISAEQIEQQVTIPLEIVMNGIPHVVHLRSFSLFGLSDLKLIFDDESDNDWNRERVVPSQQLLERIRARWPLTALEPAYRGEVARRYAFDDGGGEVGFISSVTQPFCGDCSRARLSSDGRFYTCLFAAEGTDLRAPLRGGASDEELLELIRAVWERRADRYSELRDNLRARGVQHVEMNYVGG